MEWGVQMFPWVVNFFKQAYSSWLDYRYSTIPCKGQCNYRLQQGVCITFFVSSKDCLLCWRAANEK
jgi:hypothetical protein